MLLLIASNTSALEEDVLLKVKRLDVDVPKLGMLITAQADDFSYGAQGDASAFLRCQPTRRQVL